MYQVKIFAKASNRIFNLEVKPEEFNLSAMDFLRLKGLPIASSCSGEGVCKKCVVSENLLSCQISIKFFIDNSKEISIGYL